MNDEQTALFKQYETEYCTKSTDISRKINAISSLSGGEQHCLGMHGAPLGI